MPAIATKPTPVRTPGWVRVAIPSDGCALMLLLARMPAQFDDERTLVTSGSVSITCDVTCEEFARSGTLTLRDDRREYASAPFSGRSARVTLEASLPPAQALDLSSLRLEAATPESVPVSIAVPKPAHVRCAVPHADGTLTPVPRVLAADTVRAIPVTALVASGTHAVSLQYAMHPADVRPSAAALALTAHDLYFLPLLGNVQTPQQHWPLVDDANAAQWNDAIDSGTIWYPPQFSVSVPAANADPATSPFSFVYSNTGVALGSGGTSTGLHATVRCTLQIAANNHVPLNNLSIALEVPYRQTGSTNVMTQRLPGTVTQNGNTLTVEIDLLDDWVRLAYAALAYGAQNGMPGPRLILNYTFMAYEWTDSPQNQPGTFHILAAGKIAAANMHVDRGIAMIGHPVLIAWHPPPQRTLLTRCITREDAVDLSYPCSSLGAFYRQLSADGNSSTAAGCQDALRLGETSLKAFEEITALATARYRVYRSLQQPGRFMAVPAAYRVGRYGGSAGSDKAFRPTILLYGQLGADPAQDRYCMTATLVADISAYEIALLQSQLAAYTPAQMTPAIALPTDPFAGASIAYTWAVPSGLDQPQAVTVVDAVVVTLSMAMNDAQLLTTMIDRSGIQGSATFTLPDGTAFNSALTIDGTLIGPGDTGPVTADLSGGTFTLTNRTQQAMNVLDAAVADASGTMTVVPVNATLAAGATSTLSAPAGAVRAVIDARMQGTVSLDELDVFVEDVTLTVTFINQIAFANHQLSALQVLSRLSSADHTTTTDLAENAVATATFTLPVTNYLTQQTLQYALAETTTTGSKTTDWRTWDVTKGTVIGITADLL